jgi:hypothetical protein
MKKTCFVSFLCFVLPVAAQAWPGTVHQRVIDLAQQLMPSALADQLVRNQSALREGTQAAEAPSPEEHHQHLDGSGGTLDQEAAASAERAIAIIRKRGDFEEFSRELGRLSHLVSDAAYSLNTSSSDSREATYYHDFGVYSTRKLDKFRPVFGGYVDLSSGFDVGDYVRSIAETANRGYPFISQAYYPKGSSTMQSSRRFDDRGPVFGIAQLSFVNAVAATANIWLYVWKEAHGDISDTPFLEKKGSKGAKSKTRSSKRP